MLSMSSARLLASIVPIAVAIGAAACDGTSTTSPSIVAVDPTVSESFSSTVPVGGSVFYSFSIAQYGNVAVTLASISGNDLPESPSLQLGIGQPAGTGCSTLSTVSATPADTAQVSGTYGPGVFCVHVADSGALVAPASFTATVAHP